MKKNIQFPIVAVLTVLMLSFGCKKTKDEAVSPTKENLAGTYKLLSIKVKTSGAAEEDVTDDYLETCQKDDLYKLNTDLTYLYVDAGTTCDPEGDYQDVWQLAGNVISFDGWNFTIQKFDGKNLVGSETITQQGITVVITGSFQKQ